MRKVLTLLCLFIGISWASAQNATGVVVSSEDGQPVIGASVLVKGTAISTVTDASGAFSIKLPAKAKTLVFSFIGMTTQEKEATTGMRVVLVTNEKQINEIVFIGYGTQSAKTVTSAISSVGGTSMKDAPATSFDQALQGRATGLQVTTPAGVVGQPPIIHIRGVNSITSGTSPLYIVDGVPVLSEDIGQIGQANGLADINPADILSIDVLKDAAAAAMYGSRAANGVILVTTKSGSHDKTKVSYDGWAGVSSATNITKMMNASEYVDYKNAAVANRYGTDEKSLTKGYTSAYGTKAFNLMTVDGKNVDTNWADAVFQNGVEQNHNVSVSGGSDKAQFFLSGNYVDQKGMVKGDTYNRLGLKANVNVKVNDYLKIGSNINATTSTTSAVDAARSGENFAVGGFTRLALINCPNIPVYNEDGTPYYSATGGLGFGPNTVRSTYSNPAQLIAEGNMTSTDVNRLIVSFYGELRPFNGLLVKTLYGLDNTRTEDRQFWSPLHGDGYGSNNGYANNVSGSHKQWVWTNTADYKLTANDHNFDFLLGMEATEYKFASWGIAKNDITDVRYTDEQGYFLTINTSNDVIDNNSLVSYFGRVNYDYKAKYMASLNFRRDGYSGLENNKWGNFGGESAAWKLSDESIIDSYRDIFDNIKLKGSWGIVGNTNIGSYPTKSYYSSYYYGSSSVYQPGQDGDKNLKWETSTKYDAGLALSILKNITLDFDYYYTQSKDLILDVPQASSKGIPPISGTTTEAIKANAGAMKNSGIEFTIGADIIKTHDFEWNSSFNLTTCKNEVTKLTNGLTEIIAGDRESMEQTNITVVGKSIGQLYLYPTKGIDKTTGRRIFITPEGKETLFEYENGGWFYRDGTQYTSEVFNQVIAGNTVPTYYGGWNNTLKYKNFDLTVFFQFSGGNKIYDGTRATTADNRYWNDSRDVLNHYWESNRTNATYAYPIYSDNYSNGSAMAFTDWVENGDYIRLKNVVFGYTFDTKNWAKSIGISSLRLYVQAQNLFVITKYKGMDPETLTNVENYNLAGGTDKNTMPQARVLTAGINLTF